VGSSSTAQQMAAAICRGKARWAITWWRMTPQARDNRQPAEDGRRRRPPAGPALNL
jgi:hypothetical protein